MCLDTVFTELTRKEHKADKESSQSAAIMSTITDGEEMISKRGQIVEGRNEKEKFTDNVSMNLFSKGAGYQ